MPQRWRIEHEPRADVVVLAGPHPLCLGTDDYGALLATELVEHCRRLTASVIVVDFTSTSFLPGGLLGGLIRAAREAAERGTECRVCVACDASRDVLAVTKIDRLVRAFVGRKAALAAQPASVRAV